MIIFILMILYNVILKNILQKTLIMIHIDFNFIE